MKALGPVDSAFRNTFTAEINYMNGDGDSYDKEELSLDSDETIELIKNFSEQYTKTYSAPEDNDLDFNTYMENDLIKCDEYGNNAMVTSVNLFWYDENGTKFHAEF